MTKLPLLTLLLTIIVFHSHVGSAQNVTSPVVEIMETYDTNHDGLLDDAEFDAWFVSVFPEATHEHEGHDENETSHEHCYHADDLFVLCDLNADEFLEESEVPLAATWMLTMSSEGCFSEEETVVVEDKDCSEDAAKAWGATVGSTVLISIASLIGVALLPLSSQKFRDWVMTPMITFAVGALVGDALLHLIPHSIGAHDHAHEEESSAHNHTEEEEGDDDKDYLWPSCVVVVGIVSFFLVEKLVGHVHHHHHHSPPTEAQVELKELEAGAGQNPGTGAIKPAGYLNLVSDGIHNFVDGLAIGAAYSSSLSTGFATTLAIFFHEIPQEFGDFAILINAGFSKTHAVMFNLATASVCILGGLIGCAIGMEAQEESEKWILSFTAGGFLYVGLVDMMNEAITEKGRRKGLLQLFGLLLGFVIMLIIAITEDEHDC